MPEVDQAGRVVFERSSRAFERGLLAALEGVVAGLKQAGGEDQVEKWLRRRLEGLGKGGA